MESKVLFKIKNEKSFFRYGEPNGASVALLEDGRVIHSRCFGNGSEKSSYESLLELFPELAERDSHKDSPDIYPKLVEKVIQIIKQYEDIIMQLPNHLDNGSYDGTMQTFTIRNKTISAINICKYDLEQIKIDNPSYYEEYKENMICENQLLDIYEEICAAFEETHPGSLPQFSREADQDRRVDDVQDEWDFDLDFSTFTLDI